VRLIHPNSLAATLDAVEEAFFLGRPLAAAQRQQVARWIAGLQGLPGSYAGMFAPGSRDWDGVAVFTGETIATRVYGAGEVEWDPAATERMARFRDAGFGNLPVCVAKTHLSITHDPALRGAPTGYVMPIREVRLAAGAGYVTCLAGDISTMPGMPSKARFREIDLDESGRIVGLT